MMDRTVKIICILNFLTVYSERRVQNPPHADINDLYDKIITAAVNNAVVLVKQMD